MKLINADLLISELETSIEGTDSELPKMLGEAIKALINRQPEVKIPEAREPDRETQSGYWFDKGWNACREEMVLRG